jgi:hypothetical protein
MFHPWLLRPWDKAFVVTKHRMKYPLGGRKPVPDFLDKKDEMPQMIRVFFPFS